MIKITGAFERRNRRKRNVRRRVAKECGMRCHCLFIAVVAAALACSITGVAAASLIQSGSQQKLERVEKPEGKPQSQSDLKITGESKVSDVTLKRGVVKDTGLSQWINSVEHPRRHR
jgi:hypothetical protein